MLPITHLAGGASLYLLARPEYDPHENILLTAVLAGSLAPDIDGLFGNAIKDHHNTVFHAPLFWLLLLIVAKYTAASFAPNFLLPVALFFAGVFLHLLLDWISARTGGIRLWYPFSRKVYSLCKLHPEKGDVPIFSLRQQASFWKHYLSSKWLIGLEIIIIISPAIIALYN